MELLLGVGIFLVGAIAGGFLGWRLHAQMVEEGVRDWLMEHGGADGVIERFKDEQGQGLAEYALILALIAIIAVAALIFLGSEISAVMSTIGQSVSDTL